MMHRLSLIAALSAAVLTGCQSVPTADEIDRMQAPDAHASHAKNLMKVFAFDMHDREDAGRGRAVTVTPEEAAAPGVDLLTSGGSGFFNGMLEKSVMAADPLETVHYFGFVPVTEAADERAVVRHVAAKTVQAVASQFAKEGWRFAWTSPKADLRSFGYMVTQDVFFEKEDTVCRIPAGISTLEPGRGEGCAVTVVVRSRDVSKGAEPDAMGFEPVPAWLDPARPHAWRVRSAALGSRMPDGSVFLTPERQRSLALATGRHTGLYAFDDNGVPYVGWEGAVERFAVSPEARAAIEAQARRAAVPMTDKVMDTVKGWWPW